MRTTSTLITTAVLALSLTACGGNTGTFEKALDDGNAIESLEYSRLAKADSDQKDCVVGLLEETELTDADVEAIRVGDDDHWEDQGEAEERLDDLHDALDKECFSDEVAAERKARAEREAKEEAEAQAAAEAAAAEEAAEEAEAAKLREALGEAVRNGTVARAVGADMYAGDFGSQEAVDCVLDDSRLRHLSAETIDGLLKGQVPGPGTKSNIWAAIQTCATA